MKISDGNWLIQKNLSVINPVQVYQYRFEDGKLTVFATTKETLDDRAKTLDSAMFTIEITSPHLGVIGVKMSHFMGVVDHGPHHELKVSKVDVEFIDNEDFIEYKSGSLSLRFSKKTWSMDFLRNGKRITGSDYFKNAGYATDIYNDKRYTFQRLDITVNEQVYGLGERFTSCVKNGQIIDIWNRDGGTSTEQAYKNVPFYLTNKGYGVFVNEPGLVSFEVATEKVSKVQFSVEGESIDFFVIDGPTPKDVLVKYTDLTGKPALPPAWSFGLWLTTSFTTNYDEQTVTSFIDGMAQRDIPLRVFHFDCFWMEGFEWCNFTWDKACFPDPQGMLGRLKNDKGLKICVWINPYIGQKSPLFKEGMEHGYLLKKPNGDVWQWDLWQAGMGVVDFTNPEATKWYQDKLRALVDMGVDCFKTDFGERIPTDVVYHDGSDPIKMHNFYTYLYNKAVFEVLEEKVGVGNSVLFARSAVAGGQQFPAHWGGDCYANYESMAETLRGGLSLSMSGFSYWSHDIGGFENTAPADIYKRWCAFGLLSSHSRLHGSKSYRVPWNYDDEACDVLRFFTKLKCNLMPYLYQNAAYSHVTGIPMLRAMALEFNEDRVCDHLETQYMMGGNLLVAPVFSEDGEVDVYLPKGKWTSLITNEVKEGGSYYHEKHDYMSLPLYVRENTLLARGAIDTKPDYEYNVGTKFELFELQDGADTQAVVTDLQGKTVFTLKAARCGNTIAFVGEGEAKDISVLVRNVSVATSSDATIERTDLGVLVKPNQLGSFTIEL